MFFADRVDAGRQLGARLEHLRGEPVVVLGLPRGGVPVALEVARALGAPLDVIVVRKLGVPFQPELGMGAVGEEGVRVINGEVVRLAGVPADELAAVQAREQAQVDARAARYRVRRPREPLAGRTAVVVDDGIATGSTARAACQVARAHGAARVVLAVPVAPRGWEAQIAGAADELVCVDTPRDFYAIGQFYADFSQTTDDEVIACLDRAAASASRSPAATASAADPPNRGGELPGTRGEEVEPAAGEVRLAGYLTVPENAVGIVVFAHGSGSSRHSPRNRHVARVLNEAGLGTLLVRPAHPGGGTRPGQRVRHRPARPPPHPGHRVAARPASRRTGRSRLLRRQHGSGGRAVGRGRTRRRYRGRSIPRRASRPCATPPGGGDRAHPAHRRRE